MVMIEGRGDIAPHPVRMIVGAAEQNYLYEIVSDRSRRRNYKNRTDVWGRGLTPGHNIPALGWVSKSELPGVVGVVGEYALYNWLTAACGQMHVQWDPYPQDSGDGGKDLFAFGKRIQVKTRRYPYGKTLIRRVPRKGGKIERFDFDLVVSVQWRLGFEVDLLGWIPRGCLANASFRKSRFRHFNLEVPDRALLPMNRLSDHLFAKRCVS